MAEGRYSQLLLGDDDEIINLEEGDECFNFSPFFSSSNSPKIPRFGDYGSECKSGGVGTCSSTTDQSSSASSTNATNVIALPKSNRKRNVAGGSSAEMQNPEGNSKKTKSENSSVTGHAKGKKKEKLGERITALQQLVSPFGKTDTASVLHEAMGYIRFLQDQVQVLSSPYLQPSSSTLPENKEIQGTNEKQKVDLGSRGLCLVPLKLTLHVADCNGADLWSSSAMLNDVASKR